MPSEHLSENGSENLSFSESDSQTLYDHEGKPLRRLRWNESNHFAIMTQIKGSVIPRVIPYCIVNGIMTYVIYELKQKGVKDITSNPSGHKYLAVIMSFLLVTRVKIIYDRYMHNATSLTNLNKACREIGQMTVTLTDADKSERAARWRHDVVYAAIVMLRVTVAVLEFQANPEQMPWDLPEMDQDQQQGMQESLFVSKFRLNVPKDDGDDEEGNNEQARQQSQPSLLKHTSDEQRTKLEEACRAPIVLAYNCRREIMKQRDGTWLDRPKVWYHPCNEEMRLLDFVGDFLHSFHDLRQLMLTPVPFPLVNMAKIFLFLWVFTIPFSLCHFTFQGGVYVPVAIIFLITFGFMGLEYVSMELSDPFGDDVSMVASLRVLVMKGNLAHSLSLLYNSRPTLMI
uniref:Bestrophin homolog n=1 Tax=Amphora coffeiformis TaxID=265554 RepID=A0A6S8J0W6_9STRA